MELELYKGVIILLFVLGSKKRSTSESSRPSKRSRTVSETSVRSNYR